ncbi:MAG TPA: Ig-like domain repeat protein [Candidatus Acidoferrales bacterium]|nr:Ig-like domain repeat protein [Candidatus Acidoferrales bacterium]
MPAPRKPIRYVFLAILCLRFGNLAVAQQSVPGDRAAEDQPVARIEHTAPTLVSFANEVGRVEPERSLARMVLVLSPPPEKRQTLLKFLDDQQNRRSPDYHHWLTPAEFGARFGVADTDTEAVRQWLQKSGFQVAAASRSKLWVEFSGTSQQVEGAFHTELHYYEWGGKKYLANATDIAIPAQFAEISRGVVSLNNFGKRPPRRPAATMKVQPNLTASGQTNVYYLAPGDFAAIYNTKGLLSGGVDGTGISIAVTAQSQIELPDAQAFRQIFITSQPNDPNYIVSGPDPGVVGPVDMQEAELDVEWAGAIAPGATIDLVVAGSTDTTSGVDLAAAYAIDNRIAPILTYTYGACEALLTPTQNEFYNSLWQQAAAEGITVLVATGDNGAAGCDSATAGLPATHGPAVNGAAATPYNVAVGGTQFADVANPSAYWGSNNANFSSALGYIPEAAWNESCDPGQSVSATNCVFGAGNFSLLAGSGGASTLYAKPAWQTGPGVPTDGMRDVPDVSLAAAASHDDVVYCNSTSGAACQINGQGAVVGLTLVGGTSVSTPAMAGILALVEEKNGAYQGQINYTLYQLARTHSCNSSTQTNPTAQNSCVFYDITAGNNSVPCAGGTPDCSSQMSGVNGVLAGGAAGAGYDLATGLGSVNATNLANFWNTATLVASQTTLQVPANFTHGTPVSVTGSVSPTTGSGTPTGNISLMTGTTGAAPDVLTLTSGAFSATVSDLPGGNYNLAAHYAGDATFAPSDSAGVAVNILPEASNVSVSVNGLQGGTAAYGVSLKVVVSPAGVSGMGHATGSVTLTDGVTTVGTHELTADGKVSIPTGGASGYSFAPGSHSLIASYSGDASFQPGASSAIIFNVSKGAPFVVVGANSSSVPTGQSVGVHAVVSATGTAAATGTVQFTVDGAAQGSPIALQVGGLFGTQAQASTILANLPAGPHTIGAIYDGSGDANYLSVPSGNGVNEATFSIVVGTSTSATPTTTTLTIAAPPMIPGDQGIFNVNVSPNTGNGTVTGTVTLWDAVGPRGAPVTITGGAATIQLEWTQGGTASVYAVYSGDANNAASSSGFHAFTVQPGLPQVTLTVQGPSGGLSQTSLIASVTGNLKQGTLASPTGFVEFWDAANGGAPQLLTTLRLTPGAAGASVAGTRARLAAGTHSLHAHYGGDNNWQAADSASAGVPSYALSFVTDPLSFKGGSMGTASVVVTPTGGFTGTVTLSCPAASFALAGYTCSFSPAQVNITDANAQSATLTLVPKATTSAGAQTGIPGATFWAVAGLWWVAWGVGVFAYGNRSPLSAALRSVGSWPGLWPSSGTWTRSAAALVASLVIGCGGGGGGGGGTGGGPLPTTTTIAVQQSGNQWSVTVTAHSSGANPSGTVSLVVDGGAPLTNGVLAGLANFNFSPSPMIGIHTLDARYSGDAKNQSSDSGAQTEVFAGNATVVVAGAGGSSTEMVPLHISMN